MGVMGPLVYDSPMRQVRILSGSLEGDAYALDGQLLIGRAPEADIQVLDSGISRRHCTLIEDDDGQVILVDLSTNGTLVGGERINRLALLVGDVVTIGACQFVLENAARGQLPSRDDEIKLASGPALADTGVRAPEGVGCGNALHVLAITKRWDHCPMCGAQITAEEIEILEKAGDSQ